MLDLFFCLHIKRRCRVVQDQYRCLFRECPRNADSLFLTTGKSDTTLTDHRVILFRKLADKRSRSGAFCRPLHGFLRYGLSLSRADIF